MFQRHGGKGMLLRYNNDKPKKPSNDGRFEGLSHLFHSFSNHEKAGQKSENREDVSLTTNAAAFGKHPDPNAAAAYKEATTPAPSRFCMVWGRCTLPGTP